MGDHLEILLLVILFSALVVLAWKLWHGQWLRFIAGNTYASDEEMKLPYQRRMGKDVATLMTLCASMIVFMIYERVFGVERSLFIAVLVGLTALLLVGAAITSFRANKGAKEVEIEIGKSKPTKPASAKLGGEEKLLIVVLVGQFLVYGIIIALSIL